MAWAPTTRLHVSGYRFLLRRMECALLRRDVRAVNEPIHAHALSLLAGCLLTTIAVAGCAILGLLRPHTSLGDVPVVMGQESGALYVRVGETWHPVLNLASARLITGANINPQLVGESELTHTKRGPLLGIPGAPHYLGRPLPAEESGWAICDSSDGAPLTTTAIVGAADGPLVRRLAPEQTILVSADSNGPTYLLYNGRRAVVNLADPVVARAMRLEGQVPRTVSRLFLNAVPEVPPITVPRIPGAGGRGPGALSGFPIGSVLRVIRAERDEYYVVLPAGVQRVGELAAELVRLSDSQGTRGIVAVAPDVIRTSVTVNALPVSTFPDRMSAPSRRGDTTLCVTWAPRHARGADISFLAGGGLPVPAGQTPVTLAQADKDGPALDAVYLPAGRNAYVRSTGLSGENPSAGPRYLVTDAGVRFGIHDDDTARDLGLPATAVAAPWPVLAALPQGPELSRQNASIARDTVAGGSRCAPQPP
jgi:type VII secretion protein EccB